MNCQMDHSIALEWLDRVNDCSAGGAVAIGVCPKALDYQRLNSIRSRRLSPRHLPQAASWARLAEATGQLASGAFTESVRRVGLNELYGRAATEGSSIGVSG